MPEDDEGSQPTPPTRSEPDPGWEHFDLFVRVKDTILSIPTQFTTETTISGILATDIFTLGGVLSATIEEQVVSTLNRLRSSWDPADRYSGYSFRRQAQTFPDVILSRDAPPGDIIMGIELKAWYLLAKEGEPSLRYQITQNACAPWDLFVVVPWVLSNVVTGSPKIFYPYIESARYIAEYRNYHWQNVRRTDADTTIISPEGVCPYPPPKTNVSDAPVSDSGNNFGRIPRTGVMDAYLESAKLTPLLGIAAEYWRQFFKVFRETRTPEETARAVAETVGRIGRQTTLPESE